MHVFSDIQKMCLLNITNALTGMPFVTNKTCNTFMGNVTHLINE